MKTIFDKIEDFKKQLININIDLTEKDDFDKEAFFRAVYFCAQALKEVRKFIWEFESLLYEACLLTKTKIKKEKRLKKEFQILKDLYDFLKKNALEKIMVGEEKYYVSEILERVSLAQEFLTREDVIKNNDSIIKKIIDVENLLGFLKKERKKRNKALLKEEIIFLN